MSLHHADSSQRKAHDGDGDAHDRDREGAYRAIKEKVQQANERAIQLRSDADNECRTMMEAAANGPWTDEMKAQFVRFTSYVTALAGEAKWTLSVQEMMAAQEYAGLDPFFKAQCVAWYDAYLRTQLRHQTISVLVKSVTDLMRLNQYGFFMVVDNRGKIAYPSAATLNSLCNFSIDDHLRHHLVTRENVGQFLPLIEFDFAPELLLDACKLCFVSFDTNGSEISDRDRPFFQSLSTLPSAFKQFLAAKRDSPSDAAVALEALKAALGGIDGLVSLIPSPWASITKTGGDAIVGIIQKLSERTSVEFTFFDWDEIIHDRCNRDHGVDIPKLHQTFEFRVQKNPDS